MKYAKSDKGYYIPKGQGGPVPAEGPQPGQAKSAGPAPAKSQVSSGADAMPVSSETSLSFEDANYVKSKDQFGNDLFVPREFNKSSTLDWNAGKDSNLFMKSWAYKKANDGTFIPVVYDMQKNQVDESMTKEMDGNTLAGGMQLTGTNRVKAEDIGKLMYKRGIQAYQSGEMGKFVNSASQRGGGMLAPTTPGQRIEIGTSPR